MTQTELFTDTPSPTAWTRIEAPGAELWIRRGLYSAEDADALMGTLIEAVPWRRDSIRVFGERHPIPRLHQWYADGDRPYTWSGLEMRPLPWHPLLARIRGAVETATGRRFDSLLINYYRDGDDTVGWHADDEPGLGAMIASLSLGAERDFLLRPRAESKGSLSLSLSTGSLLIMAGETQANWQHSLPRRRRIRRPRLNLSFRSFCRDREHPAPRAD